MGATRKAYPAEFRARIVELVRSGRKPLDLAKEFESTVQTINAWVRQADRDEGRRESNIVHLNGVTPIKNLNSIFSLQSFWR